MHLDEEARTLEVTVPVDGDRPRTVRIESGRPGFGRITILGWAPGRRGTSRIASTVRHVLRLDQDLSGFYGIAENDPDLAWVTSGAGRMIQSPTVFEDVVKTVCTTNCTWSATERMVGALVEHQGEAAPGAPPAGTHGRAFPTPRAMAEAGEPFYRDVARAGYRGAYLLSLARSVAQDEVDIEALGRATVEEISDGEVEAQLLALPGVGPYAAAHIMMMLGRYSRLILDSWSRPKYARLTGGRQRTDKAIVRRFRRYGSYAGLAFWMFLTRDWVEEGDPPEAMA